MDFKKRQLAKQEAEQKAAEEAKQAQAGQENCSQAKQAMAALEVGRVARYNEKGERYFLDDQQLALEKARTRDLIAQWCK
jgi:hypothetical protein